MRYSVGESLRDYGFAFLESIHEPIYLVGKNGRLLRSNAAGRKLLAVCHLDGALIGQLAPFKNLFADDEHACRRLSVGRRLQLLSRRLSGSDYFLVEVTR